MTTATRRQDVQDAAIAVIAGLGTLIGVQVSAEYPTLVTSRCRVCG